ncbi:hypothetical protein T492DRAFT_909359 [Pavlovales sp. CCMP2436]|nr:hypothetical protein T492DRAFT_909359 [Pavlovales sp. CCMP2436]
MSASPALSHFDLEPDPTFLAAVASFRELRIFETPFQRSGHSEGLPASWKPSSEAPWKQGDELLSMLDFLQRTEDSSVPSSPPFSELHPDFAFACEFVADPAKFANQMSRFAKAAASLEPWDVKLLALRPAHFVAMDKIGRQLRPAVIAALTDAIVWPDQKLAFFMVKGFPATGNLPDSHYFRAGGVEASIPFDKLMESDFTWSRSLERVISATACAAFELELHPPTFVKGVTSTLSAAGRLRTAYERTLEEHEASMGHIAASSPPGALPKLGLGSDDVQAAYRVLPSSQPGLTVAALWCPHPDGDWARGHYFSKRKASGQAALDLVFSTVGLGLDIGKHKEVAVTNIFLGLEFNFSDFAAKDLIYVGVSQKRRDTLGLTLDKVLAEDYLTSGNAASLCGKLRFTLSPLFSCVPTIVLTDAMYQRGSSRPAGLGAVYSFSESTGIVPRRIFTFDEADAAFLAALANFGERATYISQLEVLAVLAAISGKAGERLRGQFSYVPSKSNLADLPSRSREALGPLLDAGFVETEMTVPPFPALGIKRGSKRAAASDPTSASPSRDSAPRLL